MFICFYMNSFNLTHLNKWKFELYLHIMYAFGLKQTNIFYSVFNTVFVYTLLAKQIV